MTRLEKLFKTIDEAYEENGAHGFDPIPFVQTYIRKRDDVILDCIQESNDCDDAADAVSLLQRNYDTEEV